MKHIKGNQWLGALALTVGAMTAGCGSGQAATDTSATETVSEAVESASDSSDAVEVSDLLRGMDRLRPQAVEGFHCDASPDITYVDVCGKSLPATVHLEWTECAAPERPGGGRGGGMPPPPPAGGEPGTTYGKGGPDGGGHGRRGGPSSGTVDITATYEAPADCAGAVTQSQTVTFEISRTHADGEVSTTQGTTSSVAELVDGAPPRNKSTQADVTRMHRGAAGEVLRSVHLTGAMSTAFSSDTPPVRTTDGSYLEEFHDGTSGTVTLAGIVRPPRNVCPWPTGGTLTRATSDGATHVLAFGPECGDATLDGATVSLPERGMRGGGRR